MMAFTMVNKHNIISLQLAFIFLFLVSTLLVVPHGASVREGGGDISSFNLAMENGGATAASSSELQDVERIKSSQLAFETKGEQVNLIGAAAQGIDVDDEDNFLVVDYTPVKNKSPIHNR